MTLRYSSPEHQDNLQRPNKPKRREMTRLRSCGKSPRISGRRILSKEDAVVPSSVTTTLTSDSTTDLHSRLDQ